MGANFKRFIQELEATRRAVEDWKQSDHEREEVEARLRGCRTAVEEKLIERDLREEVEGEDAIAEDNKELQKEMQGTYAEVNQWENDTRDHSERLKNVRTERDCEDYTSDYFERLKNIRTEREELIHEFEEFTKESQEETAQQQQERDSKTTIAEDIKELQKEMQGPYAEVNHWENDTRDYAERLKNIRTEQEELLSEMLKLELELLQDALTLYFNLLMKLMEMIHKLRKIRINRIYIGIEVPGKFLGNTNIETWFAIKPVIVHKSVYIGIQVPCKFLRKNILTWFPVKIVTNFFSSGCE